VSSVFSVVALFLDFDDFDENLATLHLQRVDRNLLGEAVARHLGNQSLNQVFPRFDNQPGKFVRYLG
jgi:hypothetical protein